MATRERLARTEERRTARRHLAAVLRACFPDLTLAQLRALVRAVEELAREVVLDDVSAMRVRRSVVHLERELPPIEEPT